MPIKIYKRAKQTTTKAIVIRYTKDKRLASQKTAHYLINDLIREGNVKQERNQQSGPLLNYQDNEFNRVNKE